MPFQLHSTLEKAQLWGQDEEPGSPGAAGGEQGTCGAQRSSTAVRLSCPRMPGWVHTTRLPNPQHGATPNIHYELTVIVMCQWRLPSCNTRATLTQDTHTLGDCVLVRGEGKVYGHWLSTQL